MTLSHAETLEAEAASWIIDDPTTQADKLLRERIRHYKLVRDLLLDKLPTSRFDVLEIGGGPLPVSDLIPHASRVVVEPLTDEYRRITPCRDHVAMNAEDIDLDPSRFDLVIATNSLDHVDNPHLVLHVATRVLRPGGYLAILCAENNALTHPHPAHAHNLTADAIHRFVDCDFETVWELTYQRDGYRYGHILHEGRRGQPAFALLLRKCSGY